MKRLSTTLLALLTASALYGAPGSQVLSDLGASGVTDVGGSSQYSRYLVRLNASGLVSLSCLPAGFQLPGFSRLAYIDPVTGVDGGGVIGLATAPYRTLQYCLTNYPYKTNAGVVYFMAPGQHPAAVIDPTQNTGARSLVLYGTGAGNTVLSNLVFYGGSGGSAVNLTLRGVRVINLIQQNNRALTITLLDGAQIDSLTMGYTNYLCTVYRAPGCVVLSENSGSLSSFSNILSTTAQDIGYSAATPASWLLIPGKVSDALDYLAARPAVPLGVSAGDLLSWSGSGWSRVPAGTAGQALLGGSSPYFGALGASNVQYGATTVKGAMDTLSSGLVSETNRAQVAESSFLTMMGLETNRALLAESGLRQALAAETNRETLVENSLRLSDGSNTTYRIASRAAFSTNSHFADISGITYTTLTTVVYITNYVTTMSYADQSGTSVWSYVAGLLSPGADSNRLAAALTDEADPLSLHTDYGNLGVHGMCHGTLDMPVPSDPCPRFRWTISDPQQTGDPTPTEYFAWLSEVPTTAAQVGALPSHGTADVAQVALSGWPSDAQRLVDTTTQSWVRVSGGTTFVYSVSYSNVVSVNTTRLVTVSTTGTAEVGSLPNTGDVFTYFSPQNYYRRTGTDLAVRFNSGAGEWYARIAGGTPAEPNLTPIGPFTNTAFSWSVEFSWGAITNIVPVTNVTTLLPVNRGGSISLGPTIGGSQALFSTDGTNLTFVSADRVYTNHITSN